MQSGTIGDRSPPQPPLTDRIYAQLKRDILHAVLLPGTTILEPELASRFGVSKTPVREALRLLVQDGWVTVLPRRGYLVRPLGLEDIREVFHLRQMVEPGLAAEAAWYCTERGEDAALSTCVTDQRTAGGDLDRALASAAAFHVRIARIAGNARAARLVESLVDEVTRLHYLLPDLGSHIRSRDELDAHTRIGEAIGAGDQGAALREMRNHLEATDRALVDAFGVPRIARA